MFSPFAFYRDNEISTRWKRDLRRFITMILNICHVFRNVKFWYISWYVRLKRVDKKVKFILSVRLTQNEKLSIYQKLKWKFVYSPRNIFFSFFFTETTMFQTQEIIIDDFLQFTENKERFYTPQKKKKKKLTQKFPQRVSWTLFYPSDWLKMKHCRWNFREEEFLPKRWCFKYTWRI